METTLKVGQIVEISNIRGDKNSKVKITKITKKQSFWNKNAETYEIEYMYWNNWADKLIARYRSFDDVDEFLKKIERAKAPKPQTVDEITIHTEDTTAR